MLYIFMPLLLLLPNVWQNSMSEQQTLVCAGMFMKRFSFMMHYPADLQAFAANAKAEVPAGTPSFDPADYYDGLDKEWPKVLTMLKALAEKVRLRKARENSRNVIEMRL